MHDMSTHAVAHGEPTSFIRKHVFSLDHKVIGLQYYTLALVAVVVGVERVVDVAGLDLEPAGVSVVTLSRHDADPGRVIGVP